MLRLSEITCDSRRVEADLVAHIGEVDARRLFAREGQPSMFAYCLEVLHLSEPETNLRIVVARASRRHPALLEMLSDGRLHLSGIALLAPHLTEANVDAVLARAVHLSKRRIEELIAELAPRPDVPESVRRLPELRSNRAPVSDACKLPRPDEVNRVPAGRELTALTTGAATVPQPRAAGRHHSYSLAPLAPGRYKVQFTAGAALREKLERLQDLMRSSVPDGDLAKIIEDAVTEKIVRLEARRLGAARRPRKTVAESDTRPGPRRLPAAVKRAVRERDGDRCAYVDRQGRRCSARQGLQFHHRHPHGCGGDRSLGNICLMCYAHNAYEAATDFGRPVAFSRERSQPVGLGPP